MPTVRGPGAGARRATEALGCTQPPHLAWVKGTGSCQVQPQTRRLRNRPSSQSPPRLFGKLPPLPAAGLPCALLLTPSSGCPHGLAGLPTSRHCRDPGVPFGGGQRVKVRLQPPPACSATRLGSVSSPLPGLCRPAAILARSFLGVLLMGPLRSEASEFPKWWLTS